MIQYARPCPIEFSRSRHLIAPSELIETGLVVCTTSDVCFRQAYMNEYRPLLTPNFLLPAFKKRGLREIIERLLGIRV